jgi:transcriptional regulator with XRE-family HTH domain
VGHFTPNKVFGIVFKLRREAAGLKQQELADICNCALSEISKIENGRKHAPHQVIERADQATGNDGNLIAMYNDLPWEEVKEGFGEYRRHEESATRIRSYEPIIIHGLLQTHDYAHAIITGGKPNAKPDAVEDQVSDRMERQRLFAKPSCPEIMIVLDESALRHRLGGAEVHRAQLDALVDEAQRTNVIIRVIPIDAPVCAGLASSFTILSFADGPDVAYSEDPVTGRLTDDPERVGRYVAEFDAVCAYALPVQGSLELIRKVREEI